MTPPNAPPSTPSSPTTLLLQRRLSSGDCGKWRTVLRFTPQQAGTVESMVVLAERIDSALEWRVTTSEGIFLTSAGTRVHPAPTRSTR